MSVTRYATSGPEIPLSVQRLVNPSFENGFLQWTSTSYNNYSSSVDVASPGYGDNFAANLTILSGNLSAGSYLTLLQDISSNPAIFDYGASFRARVQVQALQGNTTADRIEVSLGMATSMGPTIRIHYVFAAGSSLPTNTTNDAYIRVAEPGTTGWISLDRNLALDARSAFLASSYASINSVQDVRLSIYAMSRGNATYDPRIKYYETGSDPFWNTTEAVVFDPDGDGIYHATTDTILYSGSVTPADGAPLSNDRQIRFIDTNLNGRWDAGEPIVYDTLNEGVYDQVYDPTINGKPIAGSLLQDPIHHATKALFDKVELYSNSGGHRFIQNGGFETGDLSGWGNTAGFQATIGQHHSGTYSAEGMASSTTVALAQSIDARPPVDGNTILNISAYASQMTGSSSQDKVDAWLGLSDSGPSARPVWIYYWFKTGDGTVPVNTTNTENIRVVGFGSFNQWLTLNVDLLPAVGYFDNHGYTPPYKSDTVVLEESAQTGSSTIAFFDDVSLRGQDSPAPATSKYYAIDGSNSTYTYDVRNAPPETFSINIASGQSVLNITSPEGTKILTNDYATQTVGENLQVTIPDLTISQYTVGNWQITTTSKNILTIVYATTTGSNTASTSFDPGSSVTIVSQTKDPFGNPQSGSNTTLIVYSSNTQAFKGTTNIQGWYNATNVVLPSFPGAGFVEAIAVSQSYIGVRTTPININGANPWALLVYATIAVAGVAAFGLFLILRRRKATLAPTEYTGTSRKSGTASGKKISKRQV